MYPSLEGGIDMDWLWTQVADTVRVAKRVMKKSRLIIVIVFILASSESDGDKDDDDTCTKDDGY